MPGLDGPTTRLLKRLPDGQPPGTEGAPDRVRALRAAMLSGNGPGPAMVEIIDQALDTREGPVPVRVLVPVRRPRGLLVFLHGGGWVAGSIEDSDTVARKLAERTGCAAVLVGYRLAPEHPYPAAVHDAYAGLVWAGEVVPGLIGARELPLVVVGEGAGGHLAEAVTVMARDRGGPPVSLQVLITPEPPPAGAQPIHAADLRGLPPACVVTAECDPARGGAEAHVEALRRAGVVVEARCHAGQMHGFFGVLELPGSERGFQQVVRAVRTHLTRLEVAV